MYSLYLVNGTDQTLLSQSQDLSTIQTLQLTLDQTQIYSITLTNPDSGIITIIE